MSRWFAINMIGVHAAALMLFGLHSAHVHHAYTLFFLVGTIGAMQVPVIGWTPLRSLEQLGPLAVFVAMQAVELHGALERRRGKGGSAYEHLTVVAISGAVAVLAVAVLVPSGYFGPFSVRVRALFVKAARTGNPLVDSVAEHQPGSSDAYWTYLHKACYLAPLGMPALLFREVGTVKGGVSTSRAQSPILDVEAPA